MKGPKHRCANLKLGIVIPTYGLFPNWRMELTCELKIQTDQLFSKKTNVGAC
jgi:hypothetical protein